MKRWYKVFWIVGGPVRRLLAETAWHASRRMYEEYGCQFRPSKMIVEATGEIVPVDLFDTPSTRMKVYTP